MDMPMHEGFPVAPTSRLKIRAATTNARAVLELAPGRIDAEALLAKLDVDFGIHYDIFRRGELPVADGVEACWVPESATVYIREDIYCEMCRGGRRALFTLGHELGHAVLAHRRTLNRRSVADVPVYAQSEWQANTFAAEFLMPLEQIRQHNLVTAERVAGYFGVSPKAAAVRLKDLCEKGEL